MSVEHAWIAIASGTLAALVVGLPVVYFVARAGVEAGVAAAIADIGKLRTELAAHIALPAHAYSGQSIHDIREEFSAHKAQMEARVNSANHNWAITHAAVVQIEARLDVLEKDDEVQGEPT